MKDIITQYMKDKQEHLYKLGELDVPDKFSYLKTNVSKVDQ